MVTGHSSCPQNALTRARVLSCGQLALILASQAAGTPAWGRGEGTSPQRAASASHRASLVLVHKTRGKGSYVVRICMSVCTRMCMHVWLHAHMCVTHAGTNNFGLHCAGHSLLFPGHSVLPLFHLLCWSQPSEVRPCPLCGVDGVPVLPVLWVQLEELGSDGLVFACSKRGRV